MIRFHSQVNPPVKSEQKLCNNLEIVKQSGLTGDFGKDDYLALV